MPAPAAPSPSKQLPSKGETFLSVIRDFSRDSLKHVDPEQAKAEKKTASTVDLVRSFKRDSLRPVDTDAIVAQRRAAASERFATPLAGEIAAFERGKLRPASERVLAQRSDANGSGPTGGIADMLLRKLATISLAVDPGEEDDADGNGDAEWDADFD